MNKIHLEITRRCPIECPKCPRTIEKGTYSANTDISLTMLKNTFNDVYFDLIICSGNLGDPIYHPDFINVVKYLQTKCDILKIHTNGSGKSVKWWKEYFKVLREGDRTVFGLDGLKDTNQLYRKNQDWDSVFKALKQGVICNRKVIWQWIPFKHNEHQISEAKLLAKRNKIQFLLLKSHRWEQNDPFRPTNKDLYIENNLTNLNKNI